MTIASAAITVSAVGSAFFALRRKSPLVTLGELISTALMAFVLAWLIYGVALAVPLGGLAWIPPLFFALLSAALLVNDIRFLRLDDPGRESQRLSRHLSRMAFAFSVAVHEPIVVFAFDLRIHPAVAFYGPFVIWPLIVAFFKGRTKNNLALLARG